MTTYAQPQDISNELWKKLDLYIDSPFTLVDVKGFKWQKIRSDIEKLRVINPALGYILRGVAYALEGDISKMRKEFEIARQNNASEKMIILNTLCCLEYKGMFEEVKANIDNINVDSIQNDVDFLKRIRMYSAKYGSRRVLESSLKRIDKLVSDFGDKKFMNYYKQKEAVLRNVSENVSGPLICEALRFLHNEKIRPLQYGYLYSEEQDIVFNDLYVNKKDLQNISPVDFDIKFMEHMIAFSKKEEIDDDKFIISLLFRDLNSTEEAKVEE